MFAGRCANKKATLLVLPKDSQPVNVRFAISRELVPYEPLLTEDIGDGSFFYVSDVSLLFNQQRLDRMSLQALQAKFDEQVNAGNSGLAELRKNISDSDLQKLVKSRYIQSLSELQQWVSHLAATEKNYISAIKADLEKQSDTVVNSTSPTGAAPAVSVE